jgi:hypothetical protein
VRCLSVVIAGASSFSPLELVLASAKKALAALYCGLQKIKRTSCPFINLPEKDQALVAQLKLTEWTSDNQLRQHVLSALRRPLGQKSLFCDSLSARPLSLEAFANKPTRRSNRASKR